MAGKWSEPFSGKNPLTNFQTLTHQVSLLADFTKVENLHTGVFFDYDNILLFLERNFWDLDVI